MGIDIRWENESGNPLEEITDPEDILVLALQLLPLERTNCLRFIDFYGDTVFNQQQIPVFISELQSLLQHVTQDKLDALQKEFMEKYQAYNMSPEEIINQGRRYAVTKISEHISKILDLAHRSKGEHHTYLKLYGD
jgi:hypothetical protein